MSEDIIKRSDAIKALKSMLSDDINTSILFFWQNQTVGRGIDKIKNLPSADRPQGEWIKDGHHIRCKECGVYFCIEDREGNAYPQNFCPNCGRWMKGADDED